MRDTYSDNIPKIIKEPLKKKGKESILTYISQKLGKIQTKNKEHVQPYELDPYKKRVSNGHFP